MQLSRVLSFSFLKGKGTDTTNGWLPNIPQIHKQLAIFEHTLLILLMKMPYVLRTFCYAVNSFFFKVSYRYVYQLAQACSHVHTGTSVQVHAHATTRIHTYTWPEKWSSVTLDYLRNPETAIILFTCLLASKVHTTANVQ